MARPFQWLSQVVVLASYAVRTIPQRLGSSLVAVVGIAGVVAVMVGVLSIAQGVLRMNQHSSLPDNAIVLRSGATTELTSGLSGSQTEIIANAPGVARSDAGALASPELFVIINLPKRSTGTDANVPLRGIESPAFEVHGGVRMVEGRRFEPGLQEVIVGIGAKHAFAGLELGQSIEVRGEAWPVVGIFTAGGGVSESEIWCDAGVLQPAYRRGNSYQTVYARLRSSDAFEEFKNALTSDPRMNVKVERESEYRARQAGILTSIVTGLGTLIAGLMALGAVFGALNTMYTAVAARTTEIATLRALGFGSGPVIFSVLFESMALALCGGLLGGGFAYLAFDGFRTATLDWSSFSQITFAFAVTPTLLVRGIVWALAMGFVGGFFPALRAARMPIATALRES
jgi:putative ABC transport system permease protein